MKMKTGKSKRKVARRLGLPAPSKDGHNSTRLRMRDLPRLYRLPEQPRPHASAPSETSEE